MSAGCQWPTGTDALHDLSTCGAPEAWWAEMMDRRVKVCARHAGQLLATGVDLNALPMPPDPAHRAEPVDPADVPWEKVADLGRKLAAVDRSLSLPAQSNLDQLQTYALHRLGELEVDVRDPATLYHVLAALTLVSEAARNGEENGTLQEVEREAVHDTTYVLGLALARFLPDAVRS